MGYYAPKDFVRNPELLEKVVEIFKGKLSLRWMDTKTERVRFRPSHPDRGLVYDDTNFGSYGWDAIPEKIRHNFSMAPRGSFMPPGLPHLGYDINRKSEVWSDAAPGLYEEAKSRHWVPTRQVPWEALERPGHSDDMERGLAQLYTDLTTMATALEDFPSKWVWHINHEMLELKSWLCAQMMDAAQLTDVFRKRALAGGTGLGRDHAPLGEFLRGVLDSGSFPCASIGANLMLAGLMQTLLRHIGSVSTNAADQTLVRFGVQDISRMLSYGTSHLRYLLAARPHEKTGLADHLCEVESLAIGLLGSPLFFSSLAVVTGGGRKGATAAAPRVIRLYRSLADEHLARCRAVGLERAPEKTPIAVFVREIEA